MPTTPNPFGSPFGPPGMHPQGPAAWPQPGMGQYMEYGPIPQAFANYAVGNFDDVGRAFNRTGRPDPEVPGTLEQANTQRLAIDIRRAMASGEISPLEIRQWTSHPWRAFPFLSTRLTPSPTMAALQAWHQTAMQVPGEQYEVQAAQNWEVQFQVQASFVRQHIGNLTRQVLSRQDATTSTNTHLREMRESVGGVSRVEGILTNAKEFIFDEFMDHPATSAGVVVAGYMLYRMLKGSPLARMVGLAAGGTVLYTFLKDRFNFQPIESIARGVDNLMGHNRAGNFIRNFRDTLRRPFMSNAEVNSNVSYFHERIQIQDTGEQVVFRNLIQQNPGQFLNWYNLARTWQITGVPPNAQLPGNLEQSLNGPGVPEWFRQLPREQKITLVVRVTDKTLRYIGRNAPPGVDPIAYVQARYVSGTYAQQGYNQWQNAVAMAQPGSALYGMGHMNGTMQDVHNGWQQHVTTAANPGGVDFLDVLLAEENIRDLENYNGPGWSGGEIYGTLRTGVTTAWNEAQGGARVAINFVTGDIPNWWTGTAAPFLNRNGITIDNFRTLFMDAYNEMLSSGSSAIALVAGTDLFRIARELGVATLNAAGTGWEITLAQAERLAIWLEWLRLENQLVPNGFMAWMNQISDPATSAMRVIPAGPPPNIPAPVDAHRAGGFIYPLNHTLHRNVWNIINSNVLRDGIQAYNPAGAAIPIAGAPVGSYVRISAADGARLSAWFRALRSFFNRPGATPGTPVGPTATPAMATAEVARLQADLLALAPGPQLQIRTSPTNPNVVEITDNAAGFVGATAPENICTANPAQLGTLTAIRVQKQYVAWRRHFPAIPDRRNPANKDMFNPAIVVP